MARDYAKRRQRTGGRKPTTRGQQSRGGKNSSGGGWRLYGAGVLTGVFLSFIVYLTTLPSVEGPVPVPQGPAAEPAEPPKPRFDFYTLLPERTIEVEVEPAVEETEVEPAADVGKPRDTGAGEVYLLQAGSFRQQQDAERRRAELLLLGLEPRIQETSGTNGRWYRVYLGPFESRSDMSRARGLTAGHNIDTLPLKRPRS